MYITARVFLLLMSVDFCVFFVLADSSTVIGASVVQVYTCVRGGYTKTYRATGLYMVVVNG